MNRVARALGGLLRATRESFEVRLRREGGTWRTVANPRGAYLADPFLVEREGRLTLFCERFDYLAERGHIVALDVHPDTLAASEPRKALRTAWHLSYPHVFQNGGRWWMVPESREHGTVSLYVCERWPDRWTFAGDLLSGLDAADSTLVQEAGSWWLVTSVRDGAGDGRRAMRLYSSPVLTGGSWRPHPVNAERRDAGEAYQSGRGAGAWWRTPEGWLRPVQRNAAFYGEYVEWRQVVVLDGERFHERPAPAPLDLAAVHHVSRAADVVAVDVRTRGRRPRWLSPRRHHLDLHRKASR